MRVLKDGYFDNQIWCQARIEGTFNGTPFVYEDVGNTESYVFNILKNDPNTFWWTYGNFGCDCNRSRFLSEELKEQIDPDECGNKIKIDRIIPIGDETLPTLELNESGK